MKIIIISGPTGTGKTTLSANIINKFHNGFVLSTDSYYKNGLLSKFLSKFIRSYFDKEISFNYQLFKKDLSFILNNGKSKHKYLYDFKNKTVRKVSKVKNNIEFLIIEGIFAKSIFGLLDPNDCYYIELKTNKFSCMNRVIERDVKSRGKNKIEAQNDFLKSWKQYYKNYKKDEIYQNIFICSNNNEINRVIELIFN